MIGLLANRPPSAKTCWGPPGILGSLTRASGRSAPHWSPCRHRPTDSCRLAARRQSSEAVSRRRFWAGCRPSVDGWCGTGASRSESASSSAPRLKANDPLQGGWGALRRGGSPRPYRCGRLRWGRRPCGRDTRRGSTENAPGFTDDFRLGSFCWTLTGLRKTGRAAVIRGRPWNPGART